MNELDFEESECNESFRLTSSKGGGKSKRDMKYSKRRWREIERLKEQLLLERSLREVFAER